MSDFSRYETHFECKTCKEDFRFDDTIDGLLAPDGNFIYPFHEAYVCPACYMRLISTKAEELGVPAERIEKWIVEQDARLDRAHQKWLNKMKNDSAFRADAEKRTAEIEAARVEYREGIARIRENMQYARQIAETIRWCPRCKKRLPTIEKKKTGTANQ